MRIAVFSDIHSNITALSACVDYINKYPVDGIIVLGDTISDCPQPQKVLKVIGELEQSYPVWHIRGNREEYFIDHAENLSRDDWSYSSYKGSLLYTYEHLTEEDIQKFKSYENHRVIQIKPHSPIALSHGSPDSSRELLYPDEPNTKGYLEWGKTDLLLCGHTHMQFLYDWKGRVCINPGSIGVAIGARACAHFAILTWENSGWRGKLLSIPYDLEQVKKQFYGSSLMEKAHIWPRCILKSLETGVNMGPLCAKLAYDIAALENKAGPDRIVPEKYWKIAAKRLGIVD